MSVMINTISNIKMQTTNLAITNEVISYKYKFSRLLEIQYPHHPENNVSYIYNQAGRIAKRDDWKIQFSLPPKTEVD